MLGLVYILLAIFVGRVLFEWMFASTLARGLESDLLGRPVRVPAWAIAWPASIVLGLIVMTWATYGVGCIFSTHPQPLHRANTIILSVCGAFAIIVWFARPQTISAIFSRGLGAQGKQPGLWLFISILLVGSTALMWQTLHISASRELVVGLSVFSDFGPHLAVIRSFSHGKNFPTEYPHFPNGHARYHFMFQFLAGNLEYLGLPIDWAFNLPSILGLVGCLLLLYSLAVIISGNRFAGVLAVVFFFFRSSLAWWDFLRASRPGSWLLKIATNDTFLGKTDHEDWGLWSQNIFVNQRHLAFALCILWTVIIFVLPLLKEQAIAFRNRKEISFLRSFVGSAGAWLPGKEGWAYLAIGIFLGLAAFWNGAVVIGALLLLFGLALFSRHRGSFLILAVATLSLAYAQNRLFLGPKSLAVQPRLEVGFLAQYPHTALSILKYYWLLVGALPIVVVSTIILLRKERPLGLGTFAFIAIFPAILATTVQFTPDIAINHKYVFITIVLLNIVAATGIAQLWNLRNVITRTVAVGLIFSLTATGMIDLVTLVHRNFHDRAMIVNLDDPLLLWAEKNTRSNEVFLTDWYALNPLLLSGRRVFFGWPYYAWGAGYEVDQREKIVKAIYGGTDPVEIKKLLRENNLHFIVIDGGNREQKLYDLHESLLKSLFPVVFQYRDLFVLSVDATSSDNHPSR